MAVYYDDNGVRTNRERRQWYVDFKTPEEYVDFKINMLETEMCIDLTYEDVQFLRKFNTETTIDNAVRSIIAKYWDR